MFSCWQLKRIAKLWNVNLKVTLWCDAELEEASLTVMVGGRIQPKTWTDPKWWEVNTPEKAKAWFSRIDMDTLAFNHRNAA